MHTGSGRHGATRVDTFLLLFLFFRWVGGKASTPSTPNVLYYDCFRKTSGFWYHKVQRLDTIEIIGPLMFFNVYVNEFLIRGVQDCNF